MLRVQHELQLHQQYKFRIKALQDKRERLSKETERLSSRVQEERAEAKASVQAAEEIQRELRGILQMTELHWPTVDQLQAYLNLSLTKIDAQISKWRSTMVKNLQQASTGVNAGRKGSDGEDSDGGSEFDGKSTNHKLRTPTIPKPRSLPRPSFESSPREPV